MKIFREKKKGGSHPAQKVVKGGGRGAEEKKENMT